MFIVCCPLCLKFLKVPDILLVSVVRVNTMVKVVKVILPSEAELGRDIKTQVPCSVAGCEKIFQHSSALNMHLVKVHKILKSDKDLQLYSKSRVKDGTNKDIIIQYHCPVKSCKYHKDKQFFTTYSNLRQHYLKVHAEKQYICRLCGSAFGMERLLRRHSTRCNPLFKCSVCNKQFGDKATLEKHCRDTSHPFLFQSTSQATTVRNMKGGPEVCDSETQPLDDSSTPRKEEVIQQITDKVHSGSMSLVSRKSEDNQGNLDCSKDAACSYYSDMETVMTLNSANCENQTLTPGEHSTAEKQRALFPAESMAMSGQRDSVKVFTETVLTSQKILHTVSKSKCAVLCNQSNSDNEDYDKKHTVDNQVELQALDLSKTQTRTLKNKCQEKVWSPGKFPPLMPKIPQQSVFIISPSYGGSVSLVNQNIAVLPRQRYILPKACVCMTKGPSPVSYTAVRHSSQVNATSMETLPRKATKRESSGTQTVIPRKRVRRAAAETQTTGDYILKKAMRSANLPILKQSRGSQVSPRAKVKCKAPLQTSHSHTQTNVESPPDYRKRITVSGSSLCKQVDALSSMETQTYLGHNRPPLPAMETQTYGSSFVSFAGTSQNGLVKPVESAGTQTSHSFRSKSLPTQDSQMQTKLSMNMSLASCDSVDLQCLEALGLTSGVTSDEATTSVRESLSDSLFQGDRDSFSAMVQADTAIDRKLAELEKSSTHIPPNLPLGLQNSVSVQTAIDPLQACSSVLPTAEMQVQTSVEDFDLPSFLSTEAQTTNFEHLYSNSTETQTAADDVLSDLLSHMETQTNEDDMSWMDLGFTDIQTQTCDGSSMPSPLSAVNVETQTSVDQSRTHSVQTQAGHISSDSDIGSIQSAETQTQTFFDLNFTDSHTQTSWNDLLKIVKELN